VAGLCFQRFNYLPQYAGMVTQATARWRILTESADPAELARLAAWNRHLSIFGVFDPVGVQPQSGNPDFLRYQRPTERSRPSHRSIVTHAQNFKSQRDAVQTHAPGLRVPCAIQRGQGSP